MKPLKTAPQILEHHAPFIEDYCYKHELPYDCVLKAMRTYAKYKSYIAYEKWYQEAINQMK